MKQIYAIALILIGFVASSQTTRIALFEEFTGENCAPCAATNPALDALVKANPTKVIMLKHQVPIPSAGPIYLDWTTDSDNRRSYYGVTSAPNGRLDGSSFNGETHPYYLDQTAIDSRAAVTSPFSVSVSHTVSSDLDSIYISVTVINMSGGAFSSGAAGSLRLHVAVIEEEIIFPTPPGTNGETDYYHINRKMFPNANGTVLADSWTAAQGAVFTFAEPLPIRVYDYNEVGVVAYVQENTTKEVHQAALSAAVAAPANSPDLAIANMTASPADLCSSAVTPEFEITNQGGTTLTAFDVRYRVNGGVWNTENWTGSLAPGNSTTVTFPQHNMPFNSNKIDAEVIPAGGLRDVSRHDNNIEPMFIYVMSSLVFPSPYDVDFESTAIGSIPNDLILLDNTGRVYVVDKSIATGLTWEIGAYEQSNKSVRFDFYTMPAGEVSDLILPKTDISGVTNPKLFFSHAYWQYPGASDGLAAYVSKDCGATWTKVWEKSGADLVTTATPTSTNRLYPQAADWTTNIIPLPGAFHGSTELVVRLEGTSDYGNTLYIDNIYVSQNAIGIEEDELAQLNIFPNPATTHAEISFTNERGGTVNIQVTDMNGRVISDRNVEVASGSQSVMLDVSEWAAGVYAVKVRQDDYTEVLRLSVTH